jgi:DNA polymerase III subunit alpha
MRYKNPFPAGVKLPEIVIPKDILDELGLEEGSSNRDILYELSRKGLRERGITELPNKKDYYDRTIMELEIFEELGFIDYILLNWDVLYFCKKQGIPTGAGRGSAAGSLVLYLLGVTNIDPIKYDLFFERFVSRSRAKQIEHDGEVFLDGSLLADVDNDISYNRRSEVIEYIEKKYKGKTSKILTLNTLSGKLCMKECGKIVSELNETEVNQISDSIPKHFGKVVKLKVAYEESESFKKLVDRHPKAFHIAKKLEGLVKNTGVHPSGLSICYYEQSDIMPLQKTNDGSLVSGYDMDDVASLSVKFDILGLRTLSVVNDVCERIGLNVNDIDPHDPLIYTALSDLQNPQGLFQIEADTNFKVCQTVAPRNLEQLSAVVAIARPGALDFKDRYANYVKTGESQSVHEFFDSVLGYTGGIPLYQEQLMKMAVKVGFSLDESEQLRRIVGKKKVDEMQAWKAKISEKVSQLENADPIIADVLWKVAEDSANYSFNKSHSISYAYLAAITVYLKFKYPQEFFLSLLKFAKFEPDSHDEIAKISQELVNFDIKLLPPDLNNSDIDFKIEGKDIRYGLNSIKGVSEKVLIHLLDFREGSFSNKYQVFSVAKQVGLNIGVLSSLIQAGLLDSFVDSNRSNLVLEAQVFNALTDREKRNFIVLGENYNYDIIKSINDVIANGMIGDDNYKCSDSVKMAEPRSEVRYVGVLVDIVKRTSKNGNEYARMEMHDEKGSMNVLFMDGERESRLTDYLNAGKKLPKKDDVVIITGSKGDDIIFANTVNTLKDKIYMKLSQVK